MNFNKRMPVEGGAFWAWGLLIYNDPLTPKEMDDYELRPNRDNPDVWPIMRKQANFVGEWEERIHIPKQERLTYWEACIRRYYPKLNVTPDKLEKRYHLAMDFPNGPIRYRAKKSKKSPQYGER